MSSPGTVPLILAQLGQAERLAQELQVHPEVQRQAAQQIVPETLLRENAKVPTTEKGEGSGKVRDRKHGGRQSGGEQAKRQAQNGQPEDPDPAPDQDTTPWSGHIVNIKV